MNIVSAPLSAGYKADQLVRHVEHEITQEFGDTFGAKQARLGAHLLLSKRFNSGCPRTDRIIERVATR